MDDGSQVIVFSLGDDEYGINISQVDIIERPLQIFEVPETPGHVEGLINLRGKVHTIFNLRKRFGMPDIENDEETKIIIVKADSCPVGIKVDSVREIVKLPASGIEDTPKKLTVLQKKYVNKVAVLKGRMVMLIDLEAVIGGKV